MITIEENGMPIDGDLECWADFASCIEKIRARYGSRQQRGPDGTMCRLKNNILFRGQANDQWQLTTTLERESNERFNLIGYMIEADHCRNEIESITGHRWETGSIAKLREITPDALSIDVPPAWYSYLVYLRHHGFPSPLLDWTESPYVAAYFAYADQSAADRVAVYAFIEAPLGGKGCVEGTPMITGFGPYATTDPRHFAQRARYTVATKYEDGRHFLCPHQEVFDDGLKYPWQDVLIKITLPAHERAEVLSDLNDYNINHYTLFQSEDALVKALGIRRFGARTVPTAPLVPPNSDA